EEPGETDLDPVVCRAAVDPLRLWWPDVATFRVWGGGGIDVEQVSGVEEPVLRLFLLGPALAVLLPQRGRLVLHASAVGIGEGAVCFLGGPGRGKSTIAAALHARGHGLVADDVTVVQLEGDRPITFPRAPQLKLWPNVAV